MPQTHHVERHFTAGEIVRDIVIGMPDEQVGQVVAAMTKSPKQWVDFMMRFELGLERPNPKRARTSAAFIAGAYVVGGLIPLAPYMMVHAARTALTVSVVITLVALAVFGLVK